MGGVLGLERELGRFLGERPLRRRRIRQALQVSGVLFICGVIVAGYVLRDRIKARVHFYRAESLYAEADWLGAISELEDARELDPSFAASYLKLVSYRSGIGQYAKALEVAEKAAARCQEFSRRDCFQVQARLATQRLDYKAAFDHFKSAEKLGTSEDILKEMVQLHRNLAQPNLGRSVAEALADAAGPVAAGELALTLSAMGEDREALVALETLRRRFPDDPYLPWVAGPVAIAAGDPVTAEREFEKLTTKHGSAENESNGRLLWAQALLFQDKLDHGRKVLNESASIDRQEGFGRNGAIRRILLAESYALSGNRAGATSTLDEVFSLERVPIHLKAFRNAALIAFEVGDLDLAEKFARIVHSLAQKHSHALSRSFDLQLQAESALSKRDFDRAIRLAGQAILERDDPQNSLTLARVYFEHGRCDEAKDPLEKVIAWRGLIVNDFHTPWTIWNKAKELEKQCSSGK